LVFLLLSFNKQEVRDRCLAIFFAKDKLFVAKQIFFYPN